MTEKVLKVAVTGLGVSRGYVRNYIDAPETDLVMVHDIDAARAEETARAFGVPRWATDFEKVLASDADMVDVSTPNHVHADQAVAALEAGKHVLCQKPMAPTVRDCRRMVDAARRAGRTLGMLMRSLSDPYAPDLRRAVAEGYLGRVASVRIRAAHRGPLLSKGPHGWRAKKENIGGGSFMQLGVHPLNYVLWILDEGVESVMGYADNLYCRHSIEGEDVVAAAGRLESGALITMESGYSSTGIALEIYGTEGSVIRVTRAGELYVELARDFKGDLLEYARPEGESGVVRVDGTREPEKIERLRAEHNQNLAFARAVLAGAPPPVPGEIGLRDVAIIQAIYRSAATGRRVAVAELLQEE